MGEVNTNKKNKAPFSCNIMETILDGIVDIAFLLDMEGNVAFINGAVAEYGYTPEELLDTNVVKLVYSEDRGKLAQAFDQRKNGVRDTTLLNIRLLSKDGNVVPFEMKSKLITLEDGEVSARDKQPAEKPGNNLSGNFVLGTARDISGRKKIELALKEYQDQAPDAATSSAASGKAARPNRLSEQLAIPGSSERLSRMMARAWATEDYDREILRNKKFQMEDVIRLTLGCSEVVMKDVFKQKQVSADQLKSVAAVAGNLLNFAVYLKALSGGVPALLNSLIGYQYELHRHCLNVGVYSALFATELTPKKMMLTRKQMLEICTGALLHDIGKVPIDRHTLEQQASMSARDRQLIQKHSFIGAKFLENARVGKEVQQIVFQHHEMFKAQSNPNIPAGANVTPFAYVVAICNVFDNLTSCKPGRKTRNTYDSLVLMVKNMQGDMFLPLLKPFIRMMGGNS